jgi:hypothetical protein
MGRTVEKSGLVCFVCRGRISASVGGTLTERGGDLIVITQAQTVAPNLTTQILATNRASPPESGFFRDHLFANEAAVAGFSVLRARYRQR